MYVEEGRWCSSQSNMSTGWKRLRGWIHTYQEYTLLLHILISSCHVWMRISKINLWRKWEEKIRWYYLNTNNLSIIFHVIFLILTTFFPLTELLLFLPLTLPCLQEAADLNTRQSQYSNTPVLAKGQVREGHLGGWILHFLFYVYVRCLLFPLYVMS